MKLEDKYPEAYFEHWLVMLSTMNTEFSEKGFEEQVKNYLTYEGEEEMRKLQNEVIMIVEAEDLMKFKEVGKRFDIKEVNEQTLKIMADVIISWN
ncbi:hypothetical protein [Pararhodonellum marinum]|uniref:hypothetical protein n=1 Tax=Pararhodonellum marinum TaxID=2755358 RepID=UPI00188E187D|nr:hypothetical protein [Pararhodonellum marinum]